MPKYPVGHVKRETQSFTCTPQTIVDAKAKWGPGRSLSSLIEALLNGYNEGKYIIEAAKP